MSWQNFNKLWGGGNENNKDHLQYGWKNTCWGTSYKHRGASTLTPAQVMDQDTYYGYAWMSFVQSMYMFHLVLLHLESYLRLHWFVNQMGNPTGNYTSSIWAKMQSMIDCVDRLVFLIRWVLAHGEIALLCAEDLSIYVHKVHFHPVITEGFPTSVSKTVLLGSARTTRTCVFW
jgi:hypothetical protein